MPYLYDPRFCCKVETNNPAIIMANLILKNDLMTEDKQFWNTIKELADYNDEKKNLVRAKTPETKKT